MIAFQVRRIKTVGYVVKRSNHHLQIVRGEVLFM